MLHAYVISVSCFQKLSEPETGTFMGAARQDHTNLATMMLVICYIHNRFLHLN